MVIDFSPAGERGANNGPQAIVKHVSDIRIEVPQEQVEAFCRKWKVREFALFGSVLTEDFRPDSDVDVMVVMEDDAQLESSEWQRQLAAFRGMKVELSELFEGRKIDLVRKKSIFNPFIRHHALTHRTVLYAS